MPGTCTLVTLVRPTVCEEPTRPSTTRASARPQKILPHNEQDNTFYAAIDVETKKSGLNFGVGHGLTHAADKTTLKMILGFQF